MTSRPRLVMPCLVIYALAAGATGACDTSPEGAEGGLSFDEIAAADADGTLTIETRQVLVLDIWPEKRGMELAPWSRTQDHHIYAIPCGDRTLIQVAAGCWVPFEGAWGAGPVHLAAPVSCTYTAARNASEAIVFARFESGSATVSFNATGRASHVTYDLIGRKEARDTVDGTRTYDNFTFHFDGRGQTTTTPPPAGACEPEEFIWPVDYAATVGCGADDMVDATADDADRTIRFGGDPESGEWPGEHYLPACMIVKMGQRVTFQGLFVYYPLQSGAGDDPKAGAGPTPLPQAPYVVMSTGLLHVSFGFPGDYLYRCPNYEEDGMVGLIRVPGP